ncbi:MAG: hypothetical protein JWO91_11 [Acidobacteriaceae bacterium]|nr:hypothetical protein [Acidobacteriaceae bacterium]
MRQNYKDARSKPYATSTDFCRIYDEQMASLYLLSLLLTADPEKAEQCFVSGIGDSLNTNSVFKEWAHLWARRSIIQNAIRLLDPRLNDENEANRAMFWRSKRKVPVDLEANPNLARVLGLNAFERSVFVMSVLEAYSNQECSLLLGCLRRDVANARTLAITRLAKGLITDESQSAQDVTAFTRVAELVPQHDCFGPR